MTRLPPDWDEGSSENRDLKFPIDPRSNDVSSVLEKLAQTIERRMANRGVNVTITNLHVHVSMDSSGAIMAKLRR